MEDTMIHSILRVRAILVLSLILVVMGCSSNSVTQPGPMPEESEYRLTEIEKGQHQLWGLWQATLDPVVGDLEFVPLRFSNLHLNALKFLEPPALFHLTVENLDINGNQISVDVSLRHPFLGMDGYTGFDVCGIFIADSSISGFDDPSIVMPGEGDSRLLNADGYSRWWNPSEFPSVETIFGYKDGLLGTPDGTADFNSTLNGYKFFCEGLDPLETLSDVNLAGRGMFAAGQKNTRHYEIEMAGGPLVFNYAVDANWQQPTGSPPWTVPDDFPPKANRVEAWRVEVTETSNTLWNDGVGSGGELSLLLDVYDWYDAHMNSVKVESPGNFDLSVSSTPVGGSDGYSTYHIDIGSATPTQNEIELLISIESEESGYGGILPGVPVTAYFTHSSPVDSQAPAGAELILEDPVQMIDPIHVDWPQLDDYSPTIGESADESLLVIWCAVNDTNDIVGDYGGASNWGSALFAYKSFDSGANWFAGQQEHFGIGASLIMRDGLKSLPYIDETRMHCVWPGYPSSTSSTNFVSQLGYSDQHNVYWKTKGERGVDAAIRDDARLVVFSDYGHEINAQISTGSDWDDPSPFWYPPGDPHPDHLVADPGYLSNVRSAVRDADGHLWLVYYTGDGGSENSIELADSSDGISWNSETIFSGDPSDYSEVGAPSIYFYSTTMYITYTRYNLFENEYELVLTVNEGSGFDSGAVLNTSTDPITDVEIISGMTSSMTIQMVTYSADGSVDCRWRAGGAGFSAPVKISSNGNEGSMPDFILDTTGGSPDAYLHFIWCERIDSSDNWGVFYRRGYIEPQ